MNIYAKTAAATVVVKRQPSQTSGYQLRYATNSKLKNAKTITVKGNKNNTIFLNGLRAGTTYYLQTRTYMTVKGKKLLFQMVFYRPLHNKQKGQTVPTKVQHLHQTPKPTSAPIPKINIRIWCRKKLHWKMGSTIISRYPTISKILIFLIQTVAYSTVEAIKR